jgi:hypothetical protein
MEIKDELNLGSVRFLPKIQMVLYIQAGIVFGDVFAFDVSINGRKKFVQVINKHVLRMKASLIRTAFLIFFCPGIVIIKRLGVLFCNFRFLRIFI